MGRAYDNSDQHISDHVLTAYQGRRLGRTRLWYLDLMGKGKKVGSLVSFL